MIRLRDAYVLASTKLRTRRIRTLLAVISAGLIFGGIILISLLLTGLQNSLANYTKAGYGGRYFLSLTDNQYFTSSTFDLANKRAQEISLERAKALKLQAKTPAQQEAAASVVRNAGTGELGRNVSSGELDQQQASSEKQPALTSNQVAAKLSGLPITKIHEGRTLQYSTGAAIRIVQNGKELGSLDAKGFSGGAGYGSSVKEPTIQALDKNLLEPFLASGQSFDNAKDVRIPVLMPLDYALELTETVISKTMPLKDVIALKQAAQKKLAGKDLTLCLRNIEASQQYGEATAQSEDLAKNGKSKDYIKPDLQLGVPPGACQPVTILRDVRTPEQKSDADFQRRLEGKELPVTQAVQARIVGFVPPAPSFNDTLGLSFLFTSGPSGSLYIPLEATKTPGLLDTFFNRFPSSSSVVHYVEAASIADYRTILKKNCEINNTPDTIVEACHREGKFFTMINYGNPSVGFQDIFKTVSKVLAIIILVILGIAVIIMMTTIGKIMADSRRETGVFRAIGARRFDISLIYLLYACLLALRAFVIALILATGVALVLTHFYGPALTTTAIDAFGTYDNFTSVSLIGFDILQLLAILGITQIAAVLASLLPIANNVGRNPIKALRDET